MCSNRSSVLLVIFVGYIICTHACIRMRTHHMCCSNALESTHTSSIVEKIHVHGYLYAVYYSIIIMNTHTRVVDITYYVVCARCTIIQHGEGSLGFLHYWEYSNISSPHTFRDITRVYCVCITVRGRGSVWNWYAYSSLFSNCV